MIHIQATSECLKTTGCTAGCRTSIVDSSSLLFSKILLCSPPGIKSPLSFAAIAGLFCLSGDEGVCSTWNKIDVNAPPLYICNPSGCTDVDGGSFTRQISNTHHRCKYFSALQKGQALHYGHRFLHRIWVWALAGPFQDTDLPFVNHFWLDLTVNLGSC